MKHPLALLLSLAALAIPASAARRAEHVFIISIDGGKPAVIQATEMPNLKRMAAHGACTWEARTIMPSITLPSHTSMLTGVGPDKHHILWNNYAPEKGICQVPTIFALAKAHNPSLTTAMIVGKVKFNHLWQPGSLDLFDYKGPQTKRPETPAERIESATHPALEVAKNSARYISASKPALCFIHFPDPDSAGHKFGWGSPEQQEALRHCDQAIGTIEQAVQQAGIASSSVILITADHGGHAKTHGEDIPDDRNIPWIASGAGVRSTPLTTHIDTFDTAATALWLLDIPRPESFDGKPVTSAFTP